MTQNLPGTNTENTAASMTRRAYGMNMALTEVSIASHPPVLRDKNDKFYGYFTCNKYKSKRANYELIDIICENYKEIREDVGDWYDKIF